jgi:hypothetical protein
MSPNRPRQPSARPASRMSLLGDSSLVLLFAAAPFVEFLNHNRTQGLSLLDVLPYGAVVGAIGVLAPVVTFWLRRRSTTSMAIAVVGALLAIFNFHTLNAGLLKIGAEPSLLTQLILWTGLFVAVTMLFLWLSRFPLTKRYLLVAGALLVLLPSLDLLRYRVAAGEESPGKDVASDDRQVGRLGGDASTKLPDVYLFVPDAYVGNDQLQRLLEFNNQGFVGDLQERGFVVNSDARSNYPLTFLSLSSILNMSYTLQETDRVGSETRFMDLIAAPEAVRAMKALGYSFIAAGPGGEWQEAACGSADLCIEPVPDSRSANLSELEWTLLELTPLSALLRKYASGALRRPSADPVNTVQKVVESELPRPRLVFSHIMQPHPPYQHHADCSPRQNIDPSLLRWRRDPGEAPVDLDSQRSYFVDSVQCLNRRLLAAIDLIQDEDPDAIIIIQADHGTLFTIDWDAPLNSWTSEQLSERFSVFQAIRLPPSCHSGGAVSPVNLMRIVIACLQGAEPELLPVRHFLYSPRHEEVRLVDLPEPAD